MMPKPVEVRVSPLHGKGVFALRNIAKGEVIVKSHMVPVHVNEQLPELLATLQFPWTEDFDAICLSDVGSFFNHDKEASAEIVDRDFENLTQTFAAKRDIITGEEVMIYYNDAFQQWVEEMTA